MTELRSVGLCLKVGHDQATATVLGTIVGGTQNPLTDATVVIDSSPPRITGTGSTGTTSPPGPPPHATQCNATNSAMSLVHMATSIPIRSPHTES